jgi:hypothetical protein
MVIPRSLTARQNRPRRVRGHACGGPKTRLCGDFFEHLQQSIELPRVRRQLTAEFIEAWSPGRRRHPARGSPISRSTLSPTACRRTTKRRVRRPATAPPRPPPARRAPAWLCSRRGSPGPATCATARPARLVAVVASRLARIRQMLPVLGVEHLVGARPGNPAPGAASPRRHPTTPRSARTASRCAAARRRHRVERRRVVALSSSRMWAIPVTP